MARLEESGNGERREVATVRKLGYGEEAQFCESELLGLMALKLGFLRVKAWFCE